MNSESLKTIAVALIAVAIIGGAYVIVQVESDVSPTFTTVESQSMQHGRHSDIGIIDTGDLIILKNKEKYNIRSYVDGRQSGYSTFGEYGNVVVYDRGIGNPVIHRVILWLDYNSDGTWSAPSLKNYDPVLWKCTGPGDYRNLTGTLTLMDVGYSSKSVFIDLNQLASSHPRSGFLTLGDNRDNYNLDQTLGIVGGPVTMEMINSVAWMEIPWGGVMKVMGSRGIGVIDTWVPDAIPSMALGILAIIFSFVAVNQILVYYDCTVFINTKKKWKR